MTYDQTNNNNNNNKTTTIQHQRWRKQIGLGYGCSWVPLKGRIFLPFAQQETGSRRDRTTQRGRSPGDSSCTCSYAYGQGPAVGPHTGERCWPLLAGVWRAIAPLMQPWCAEEVLPTAAIVNARTSSFIAHTRGLATLVVVVVPSTSQDSHLTGKPGEFFFWEVSSWCLVHMGSASLAGLPVVYQTWVTQVCLLLDTPFGRRSVGALPL